MRRPWEEMISNGVRILLSWGVGGGYGNMEYKKIYYLSNWCEFGDGLKGGINSYSKCLWHIVF